MSPTDTRAAYEPVAIGECREYDCDKIYAVLCRHAELIGMTDGMLAGKRVVIKPNFVMSKKPERAATTHPAFIEAAVRLLRDYGASDILLAESPGGPYTEATLRLVYSGCDIADTAKRCSLSLNYSSTSRPMEFADGVKCRRFNVITPICDADVIVNLCKLKSHSLTKLSCAVKNFFGVIPGIEKFEMHSHFSRNPDFCEMLVDLCEMLYREKTLITFCDGIIAMEGNGPTGGTPRRMNVILSGMSPFTLDTAAAAVIGYEGTVSPVKIAGRRSLAPDTADGLTVLGGRISDFAVNDFVEPDTKSGWFLKKLPDYFGGGLAKFFEPRPIINNKKCVGCSRCVQSCPKHTITVITAKGGKKQAKIAPDNCIRCYCCQELCPIDAVKIKKNIIIKILH